MSQESSRFAIGVFIIGAVALFIGGVVLLGSGVLFRETQRYVSFFDGSVKGLGAGAPVLFKGVHIGEVKRVVLQIDHTREQVRIPIIFEMYPGSLLEVGDRPKEANAMINRMIEQGLRSRLVIQSIVTGTLALSLDFYPDSAVKFVGEMPLLTEIPSIPSALDIFSDALGNVPFQDVVMDLRAAMTRITKVLESDELLNLPKELTETVAEFRESSRALRGLIREVTPHIGAISSEVKATLKSTENTMQRFTEVAADLRAVAKQGSPMRFEVDQLIKDLRAAAQQTRSLTEYLERHPDSLLRGKQ